MSTLGFVFTDWSCVPACVCVWYKSTFIQTGKKTKPLETFHFSELDLIWFISNMYERQKKRFKQKRQSKEVKKTTKEKETK